MNLNPSHEQALIDRFAEGENGVIGELVALHQDRIKRMIQVRMDFRLRQRLDASDVFQELQIDVIKRMSEFVPQQSGVSFFQWLRFLARQKLAELHRRHIQAQGRSVERELQPQGDASSVPLANFLIANVSSPSLQVSRREIQIQLELAVAALDDLDRESILLRHAEHLSTTEAAAELGITANTFRQRYFRALKKLKASLEKCDLSWG